MHFELSGSNSQKEKKQQAHMSTMKAELFRALERIGNLIVGNFTVSFQNELRFMSEAAGSTVAQAMRADSVPMQQVAKHTAGALARL